MYGTRLRVAATAVAYFVSAILGFFLPGFVGWAGKLVLAFFLPTMAVAISVLFRQIATSGPLRIHYRRFHDTYELVLNAAVIFIVGLHLTLMATLLEGPSRWMGRIPSVLIGVLLVAVGYALPRIRPNLSVGIVAPWTPRNERVWAGTHRVGGHLLVVFGIIILACVVLAPQWLENLVVFGAVAGAISLAGLSYWSGRSQLEPDRQSPSSAQGRSPSK